MIITDKAIENKIKDFVLQIYDTDFDITNLYSYIIYSEKHSEMDKIIWMIWEHEDKGSFDFLHNKLGPMNSYLFEEKINNLASTFVVLFKNYYLRIIMERTVKYFIEYRNGEWD